MNAKVFINYRREDAAPYAGRLYDRLTAHFSEDQVFIDIDQIEPGEDFVEIINRKVSACDIAIVAIGPRWLSATDASGKRRLDDEEDFVRMEIVAALQRKIRVIPVLVGGAQMPRKQDLPEALAPLSRRNAIELSETRFHADVNRLIEAIEKSFTVAEERNGLSATPVAAPPKSEAKEANDLTTPTTPPIPSTSANAALKEPKVWPRKRVIIVGIVGTTVILVLAWLLLGSFLMLTTRPVTLIGNSPSGTPNPARVIANLNRPSETAEPNLTDQGDAASQWNLGVRYEAGLGVPKDLVKAAELYQKAADQGNTVAKNHLADPQFQINLGLRYQQGDGVPQDFGKAAELCQKAADQENGVGQSRLGWLYENGWGVPKDLVKARELYQKAARHGEHAAISRLKELSGQPK